MNKEKKMSERTVQHATIVVERKLKASPARVFRAWADQEERARWDVPGDDWVIAEYKQDFRVGGGETSRFGPKGNAKYFSDGSYLDIVQNARIVSAGTMHADGKRSSSTLCTVELLADGSGTKLILTDQSAFFDSLESEADRKSGWGAILDRLEAHLRT